jgi:hypothetical protein
MDKQNFTMEEAISHQMDDTRDGRVALGSFVKDINYGRIGRVVQIHTKCPESQAWINGQEKPYSKWEQEAERWISVLIHNGGSIVVTENRLKVIKPFKMKNNWYAHYFGINDSHFGGNI